jgi:chromosome segregation ATPase
MISMRILRNIERSRSSKVEAKVIKRRAAGLMAVVLILAVSMTAPAQDRNLPYVDIEAANAEIASLQADTQERTTQSEDLDRQNEELLVAIQQDQQSLVEIDPILARVDAELTELFAVNRTIVDEQMKTRSQEAIGRARTIKTSLQGQIRTLNERIQANRAQIESNRSRVRINNRRIGENEERILFLEAAIRQTEAQQQRLDRFITNVDSILSDAEQYVEAEEAPADE